MSAAAKESVSGSDDDLPYPLFDGEGMVYCQKCGRTFLRLKMHITTGHDDLTVDEYVDQYGEDLPMAVRSESEELPPSEMTIGRIAEEADRMKAEIAEKQDRLSALQMEFEARKERIEELDEVFESMVGPEKTD